MRKLRNGSRPAILVPFSLRFVDAINQFLVLQKLVRFDHPRLPERLHIFSYDAFPQGLLRLLASGHAPEYRCSETRSIVNVSAPTRHPTLRLARGRQPISATESSYAFSGTAPRKSGPTGRRSQKLRRPEAELKPRCFCD